MSETSPRYPEMPWPDVVDRVLPSVYRVTTNFGMGTGFLFSLGSTKDQGHEEHHALFVTARHVIAENFNTSGVIKLESADGSQVFDSTTTDISVAPLGNPDWDTALILVKTTQPISRESLLPSFPYQFVLPPGAEIAWLGFPALVHPTVCFFSGRVSGFLNEPPTYLVDGVAINGVSGGPVFDNRAHLIGIISSYIPNQVATGVTLPGLLSVMSITMVRYWVEKAMGAEVI